MSQSGGGDVGYPLARPLRPGTGAHISLEGETQVVQLGLVVLLGAVCPAFLGGGGMRRAVLWLCGPPASQCVQGTPEQYCIFTIQTIFHDISI